jgi:four helix bundle protein
MSYIPIDDLEVYKVAMEIGEEVWAVVEQWDRFQKEAIGSQFCEAADSIAANIAEGHGRFHYKENRNFCFYARGSLLETKTWLKKSHNRNLVDATTFSRITGLLSRCHLMLNKYIKSIGTSGGTNHQLREPDIPYGDAPEINDLPF